MGKSNDHRYVPLTGKKRFKGSRNSSFAARKKLEFSISAALMSIKNIFSGTRKSSFDLRCLDDYFTNPLQKFLRLTASRVFYLFDETKNYIHFQNSTSKSANREIESFVKSFLEKKYLVFSKRAFFCHPIWFFLGCEPDLIIQEKSRLVLVEIKGIYAQVNGTFNELGEIHDPERDFANWAHQIQFSLHCTGITEGRLIVVKYPSFQIISEKSISRCPKYIDENFEKFQAFYLDNILYQNASLRHFKPALRKRMKNRIRDMLKNEIELAKNSLMEHYGADDPLSEHFENINAQFLKYCASK